ncbi:ribonuclease D [Stutzerimonas kirkiae]|uniref:ribonuclease D n=1 Tax=Stutzerimonas kirkiae TaxID=2211392 RepID=UPI001A95555D|nr:ribonuclease D [Stutzerimonas kirkiae]
MSLEIQWVLDNEQLARLCRQWCQQPYVALDTEFMRVDTFYPIAGLLQVCDGREVWLVDPLRIDDWSAFAALLEKPEVVKVLHASSEDLEVFLHLAGALPAPLFDTQLAAGYLNIGFSMGYSRLVQQVLGIELPKGETRSDWLQRPLSELQVRYAAEDVQYLAELYVALGARLSAEKLAWVLQDGAEQVGNLRRVVDPRQVYRDLKQAWRLQPQQLAVLRELSAWRETQARERDVPRNRVVRENSLWPMARTQPGDLVSLARIEDMHPRTVREDGETLLELIHRASALPEGDWPEVLPEPLPLEVSTLLKKLRAVGQREAQRLDIAPELMLRKKVLEALLKTGYPDGPYQLPESLRGWRRELMGQALLDTLEPQP